MAKDVPEKKMLMAKEMNTDMKKKLLQMTKKKNISGFVMPNMINGK